MRDLPKEPYAPTDLFMRLRGQDVIYIPNTGNAGDGFIAFATMQLLDAYGVNYEPREIDTCVRGKVILFGGGGNLIENRYHTMADAILRNVEDNECFVLPHSIDGFAEICKKTRERLYIFCRDPISYTNVIGNGADASRVSLAHDMTFYLDDNLFVNLKLSQESAKHKLFALRTDGEMLEGEVPWFNQDVSLQLNGMYWANKQICSYSTMLMAARLSEYQIIVTDRLHVAILGAYLGKKVLLGPNAYYKNKAVYNHSMLARWRNVTLFESKGELLAAAENV